MKKTLWFDIETSGLGATPRQGERAGGVVEAAYITHEGREWQGRAPLASNLGADPLLYGPGKKTYERVMRAGDAALSERQLLENLITQFSSHDVIAGYNIGERGKKGFDIPYLRRRAKQLGLGREMGAALHGKEFLDVGNQVKDILAQKITSSSHPALKHLQLGWKRYLNDPRHSYPAGWSQEVIHEFLGGNPLEEAHEALVDARASRGISSALLSSNSAFQAGWEARLAAIHARIKGGKVGRSWSAPKWLGLAVGVGLGATALFQAQPLRLGSLFSGRDDDYNVLEGLPHSGFAGATRRSNTDFGSGYQGLRVHGQVIAPEIQAFRDKYFSSPATEAALEQKLEDERQAAPGKFGSGDLIYDGSKRARVGDLSQFSLKWEDADTLLLQYPWYKFWKSDISIRLAGVDAPETSHSWFGDDWSRYHQEQPWGEEAKRYVENLDMSGARVEVASDPAARTYGRYLGLVYLRDQREPLNIQLVREGMAAALPYGEAGSDIYSREKLRREEQLAINDQRGLWGSSYFQKYLDVSKGLGGRLTFNTLSDLSRLAKNYHLAAAQSWMENDDAPYTPFVGRYIGKQLIPSYGRFFHKQTPSLAEGYNSFDGLPHGGMAEEGRHKSGPFGSKYDVIRDAARHYKMSLAELVGSAEWKAALQGATLTKDLSAAGAFGEVGVYRSKFREFEFEFVKKKVGSKAQSWIERNLPDNVAGYVGPERMWALSGGANITREARALSELGETPLVPSLYGLEDDTLYMEKMVGDAFGKQHGAGSTSHLMDDPFLRQEILETTQVMEAKGIWHSDIHSSNILYSQEQGRAALIDFGGVLFKGEHAAKPGEITSLTLERFNLQTKMARLTREEAAELQGQYNLALHGGLESHGPTMPAGWQYERGILPHIEVAPKFKMKGSVSGEITTSISEISSGRTEIPDLTRHQPLDLGKEKTWAASKRLQVSKKGVWENATRGGKKHQVRRQQTPQQMALALDHTEMYRR